MESMIFFVKVCCKSFFHNAFNYCYADDIFIASTSVHDIPSADLHDITVEMVNDPQQMASRRNHLKQIIQSPIDHDTPNTQATSTGPISIDVKKTGNVRDSGFLDDEDGQSGRDSELPSTRQINTKSNEIVNAEEPPTSNDLFNRKIKSTKIKQTSFSVLKIFSFRNNI